MKKQVVHGVAWAIAFVCGLAVTGSVFAIDGFVRQGDISNWSWADPQYWTDAAGQPLGTYPHQAGDTASIACTSNAMRRACLSPQATFQDFALAKLTGGALTFIQMYSNSKGTYPAQRLTIDDPDGFPGWWGTYLDMGRAELVLNATPEHEPKLSALSVSGRNNISVPAGTTASVGALFGDGALGATGSGTLKVGIAPGGDSNLFAPGGTVEIAGAASGDAEDLVKTAAFRLDASADDTLTYGAKKSDERQYVIRWTDANGGSIYAYTNKQDYVGASRIDAWDPPFVAEETSPTGLRLIDFGDRPSDSARVAGRPVNGWMRLSSAIAAREVFYVFQTISASSIGGTVAGSVTSACNFRGGLNDERNTAGAYPAIDYGDIRVNNQRTSWANRWTTKYGSDSRALSVTSLAISDDDETTTGNVSLLGSYAWNADSTGNIRLGEFLVFTNRLTSAQRTAVNRYLMKKWLKDAANEEFGEAVLGNGTTTAAVSVPSGETTRIGDVTVDGGTLVKKGAGTLEIGRLMPHDTAIDVQGGKVKIAAPHEVSDSTPASEPYFWLDADDASSVVTQKITNVAHYSGDSSYYVTRWNDCRKDHAAVFAETPPESTWGQIWTKTYATGTPTWFPTNYPKFLPDGNHTVVDFGHASDSRNPRSSFMWINFDGTVTGPGAEVRTAYDAFIVFKWKAANLANNHFGSSSTDVLRGAYGRLLDPVNSSSAIAAGACLYDGQAVDPWTSGVSAYGDATEYHVLSYSCASKMPIDMLAKDRLRTPNSMGQMMIGEFLLYDRRLTRAEREQTTAYLLKKWRNEALPGSAADEEKPQHALNYASTVDVGLSVEADAVVPKLSGGNGIIIKDGAGAVAVEETDSLGNLKSISVSGGKLALPLWKGAIASKMLFDFDATASERLETNLVGGVTSVTRWFDARPRREGIYAISSLNSLSYIDSFGDKRNMPQRNPGGQYYRLAAAEDPTLKSVETAEGVTRQVVDFGTYGTSGSPAGASMDFLNCFNAVAEVHTIFKDADASGRAQIVAGYPDVAFLRAGSACKLLSASSVADVRNGYIAIDGEAVASDAALPSGFHLVSFAPLSAQKVGDFCTERQFSSGGAQLGEQVGFSSALTAEERAYLQGYLMWKWMGAGTNPSVASLETLAVAEGSELDLGDRAVSAESLDGAGTVKASAVRGVSAATVDSLASPIVVDGALEFAAGTVTVTLSEDVSGLAVGSYTLFSAGSIDDSGVTEFAVVGNLKPSRIVRCRVVGNDLVLTVEKRGMAIIVR